MFSLIWNIDTQASRFTGVNSKEELCPLAEPWFFSAFWTILHVFCSFSWEWLVFGGKTSVLPQHLSTARGQTIQNWWQTKVSKVGFTWPVCPKQGRKDEDKQMCSDLCTQGHKNKRGRNRTQMSGSLYMLYQVTLLAHETLYELMALLLNRFIFKLLHLLYSAIFARNSNDTNQVKKSLTADPDSQLAHWKGCDTLNWTYLNKF